MEQRREAELSDVDMTSMSVLLGVVAAAFVTLGVTIYLFGEDQSSTIAAANNSPPLTERMLRNKSAAPTTFGQGGQSSGQNR
jgi:hypothetical protein